MNSKKLIHQLNSLDLSFVIIVQVCIFCQFVTIRIIILLALYFLIAKRILEKIMIMIESGKIASLKPCTRFK